MEVKLNPSVTDFIELGKWLERLSSATWGVSPWTMAKSALEALAAFKDYKGLEFIVKEAEWYINNFGKKYSSDDDPIKPYHAESLRQKVQYLRGRMIEVSEGWVVCSPTVSLDIHKLKKGVKSFLTDEEWLTLTRLEQNALDEAIACLLFNAFTSAEFTILRLVESLLRRWYKNRTNKDPGRLEWFGILDKLNQEFPQDKRPKELSLLDYLRQRRNEIAHPEVISSSSEAETTFLNGINLFRAIKTNLLCQDDSTSLP